MDTISSAQFRKTYAKLVGEVTVTVNGHPIGRWTPVISTGETVEYAEFADGRAEITKRHVGQFSSRPFTPAPKPGRR